jgi:hypothetical protein
MRKMLLEEKGDYSLFARLNKDDSIREYVVAWAYDKESDSWGQGFYITNLASALEFFKEKTRSYDCAKKQMIDALEKLRSAWIDCDYAFGNSDIDCNDYIVDYYPFDKSFDDMDTIFWIDNCIELLKK